MTYTLFRVAILTVSDKGYAGERVDESGPLLREKMEQAGYEVVLCEILPDNKKMLSDRMRRICNQDEADLLLTTGGTGFSSRDVTPEATLDIAHRNAPGIAEAMRMAALQKTPHAMLSRGLSVIRRETLVVNLPGSPRAAGESLDAVLPALWHGLEILVGRASECGASSKD